MVILDLFAGLGGEIRREKIESMGHTYVTLDIDSNFKCNITKDIMQIDDLGQYDFIWASPPCDVWSVMNIGKNWHKDTNDPKTQKAADAILLVKHTLKLINESARIGWVLENPMGKLRKMDFMQGIRKNTVTYCQYGEKNMKPTDIFFCGFDWTAKPMCKNGDPCHSPAPRGSRQGVQGVKSSAERAVVPFPLWEEILWAVQKNIGV